MATTNQLEIKHPLYTANIEDYDYYWNHYEGNRNLADLGDYLDQGPAEADESFKKRKKMTGKSYRNYCQSIAAIFKNHIWSKDPQRTGLTDELVVYLDNADRQGTNLNDLMQDLDLKDFVYGKMLVLVDLPAVHAENLKEEKDQDIRPYPVTYSPREVINWKMNGDKFDWLVLQIDTSEAERPGQPYQNKTKIVVWEPDKFTVYEKSTGTASDLTTAGEPVAVDQPGVQVLTEYMPANIGDYKRMSEGVNPFGIVPAFWTYHEKRGPGDGRSGLKGIAELCNLYWNKTSLMDMAEYWVGQPMTVIKSDQELTDLGIGKERAVRLGVDESMEYLYLPSDSLAALDNSRQEVRRDIYRLALRKISEKVDSGVAESAEAKNLDREELKSYLEERAKGLQDAEMKLWNLIALGMKKPLPEGFAVTYNTDFNIEDIDEDMRAALDLQSMNIPSTTLMEKTYMNVVKKYFPSLDDDTTATIEAEIKEGLKREPNEIDTMRARMDLMEGAFNRNSGDGVKYAVVNRETGRASRVFDSRSEAGRYLASKEDRDNYKIEIKKTAAVKTPEEEESYVGE